MNAFARSEELLLKVDLLLTAMMGLQARARIEVLDDDIWPVTDLAGDVRIEMRELDRELQLLEYPRVNVLEAGRHDEHDEVREVPRADRQGKGSRADRRREEDSSCRSRAPSG